MRIRTTIRLILPFLLSTSLICFKFSSLISKFNQKNILVLGSSLNSMSEKEIENLLNSALNAHKIGDIDNALKNYNELLKLQMNPKVLSTICNNVGGIYMSGISFYLFLFIYIVFLL